MDGFEYQLIFFSIINNISSYYFGTLENFPLKYDTETHKKGIDWKLNQ